MEFIFHEKQSGSLCAQHCLNALLQGPYYTVFDLAEIARSLDESERHHMAERGFFTHEYQEFLKQPSSNFDDSGFFSIQVIVKALEVLNLELLPITSSDVYCRQAREHPSQQVAFICNFRQHWFTVRKIGLQWFNLNSVLSFPELISDTYLSLFLKQLQVEGYSIFVLRGELPACEADDILKVNPVVQTVKPTVNNSTLTSSPTTLTNDDPELKWVMEESKKMFDDDDEALNHALQLSASEMYESDHIASYWSRTSATTTATATASATSVTSASEMTDTQPTTSTTSAGADIQLAPIATDTSTATSETQHVTSVATTSAMQPPPTTSTTTTLTTTQSESPSPTLSPSSSNAEEIRKK
ncbi:hypothetical protein HELRODRAFT_189266 [Helobdella robusta]|uniref:ubiquitinyl hydrolase 1 n=1 Tax=Helobdella robusta TaxID=6412 RepID=T1FQW1_HELRO|nr:hypothetical protein HELRODRAFT_189266 [Helobdella robusta]ESN96489.1 hypothetical protein HELRODRAFT_189266 [Helobdella robusta]